MVRARNFPRRKTCTYAMHICKYRGGGEYDTTSVRGIINTRCGRWYCERRRDAIVRGNLNHEARARNGRFLHVSNQYRGNIRQPPTRTPAEKVALSLSLSLSLSPSRNLLQSLRAHKYPGGSPEPLISFAVREHKIKRFEMVSNCSQLRNFVPTLERAKRLYSSRCLAYF